MAGRLQRVGRRCVQPCLWPTDGGAGRDGRRTAGERTIPARWGVLRLQGRLEYAQMLSDSGEARVGYADTGNDTWRVPLTEQSRQSVTVGTGIDFLLPHSITPSIAYQATLGLDAARTQEQMVMIRLNIGF